MNCVVGVRRGAGDRRLAGQPDPDVAVVAVDRAGRGGVDRRRGPVLHPPARRVPRGEPAGLAVDGRRGHRQALRLLPLAGAEARAPQLCRDCALERRVPDPGLAAGRAPGPTGPSRSRCCARPRPGVHRRAAHAGRAGSRTRCGSPPSRSATPTRRSRPTRTCRRCSCSTSRCSSGCSCRASGWCSWPRPSPTWRTRRDVEVRRGEVAGELAGGPWPSRTPRCRGSGPAPRPSRPAVVHPWRWLYRPHAGPIGSYSAWRKGLRRS